MRQYKFRAWEDGEMYYQVRCGGIFDDIPTAPTVWNENIGEWLNLTGQPHTKVMQWTGLKDKNDIEIYEGDIVRYLDEIDGVTKLLGFVEWERCWWSVNLHPRYLRENDIMDTEEYINYEVIGNIYENPDILK